MRNSHPSAAKLAELKARIAVRLQPICADWPDERFAALVDSVARITLKYELIGSRPPGETYDRDATERLIGDMKDLARRSAELHETDE
jgi:hypothetical protein